MMKIYGAHRVGEKGGRAMRLCCRAMNASCLACSRGVTVEAFCRAHPGTLGCTLDEEDAVDAVDAVDAPPAVDAVDAVDAPDDGEPQQPTPQEDGGTFDWRTPWMMLLALLLALVVAGVAVRSSLRGGARPPKKK